jgi:hypothetical protein
MFSRGIAIVRKGSAEMLAAGRVLSFDHVLIIVLYVDDLIITGSQLVLIQNMKSDLQKQFEMMDLDILHYFLGLQIWNMANGIFLSQPKYTT